MKRNTTRNQNAIFSHFFKSGTQLQGMGFAHPMGHGSHFRKRSSRLIEKHASGKGVEKFDYQRIETAYCATLENLRELKLIIRTIRRNKEGDHESIWGVSLQ